MRNIQPNVCPTILAFGLAAILVHEAFAQSPLELQLQRSATVSWQGQQLKAVLQRLADAIEFPIWLDRRIDPQRETEARYNDLPIRTVLENLAELHGLGIAILEDAVYIGPQQSADELLTMQQLLRDAVDKVPSAQRRLWLAKRPAQWHRLSEPRDILENTFKEFPIQLTGAELVSHDLWQARELSPLTLVDRVALILIGFDLTYKISPAGNSCKIVPIERPVVISREYSASPNDLAKLQQALPDLPVKKRGRNISVETSWRQHLQVQELLGLRSLPPKRPAKPSAGPASERRFTLKLQNQPADKVVAQLAQQLKLQVVWDEDSLAAANVNRDASVSCDVKNVDLDQLLQSVLVPAGLEHTRTGNRLQIKAKP